jgi:ABC-type glycerol-3-phosphate transport system substrate-binding protein
MNDEKLSRRDFLRLSAITAAGLTLFGCAPAATSTPAQQAAAATATTAPAATATMAEATATMAPEATATTAAAGGGEVTLSFWNMPFVTQEVSPQYVTQWEEAVAKALPNIKVDSFFGPGDYGPLRQKFLLQAKSGTPDVIEGLLEDTAVYVKNGLIDELDARFDAWSDKDQFVPATVDPLRINGKLYGIPYNTNARALIYRKDILEKYNLAVPTTWTEMIDTARKITQATNKEMFGFFACTLVGDPRAPQEFISWYYQVSNGKHMFDTSGATPQLIATTDDFEKILTLYNDMFTGDYPAVDPNQKGTGWPVEDPGYANGKWAMCPMGPWLWGRRTESPAAKDILVNQTEIVELPIPEGGGHYTYLEVKPIMLNHYSEHPDDAWELIKFICSKEEMGLWLASSGGVPARKDALTIPEFQGEISHWIQGFAKLLDQGVALVPVNWGPVNEANLQAVNYVIYNQKSPKEAAQWLYDQIGQFETNKTL